MIETLDALNKQRPSVVSLKRKHFDTELNANQRQRFEWMRLNAEKDRIS